MQLERVARAERRDGEDLVAEIRIHRRHPGHGGRDVLYRLRSRGHRAAAGLVNDDRIDVQRLFRGVVRVGDFAQGLHAGLRLDPYAHVEIAAPGAVRLEPDVLVEALGDQGLLRVVGGRGLLGREQSGGYQGCSEGHRSARPRVDRLQGYVEADGQQDRGQVANQTAKDADAVQRFRPGGTDVYADRRSSSYPERSATAPLRGLSGCDIGSRHSE